MESDPARTPWHLSIGDVMLAIALLAPAFTPYGLIVFALFAYVGFPHYWLLLHAPRVERPPRTALSELLGRGLFRLVVVNLIAIVPVGMLSSLLHHDRTWMRVLYVSYLSPCFLFPVWMALHRVDLRRMKANTTTNPLPDVAPGP